MALGRLRDGEMNKTEKAYQVHLEIEKKNEKILWYSFEGLKFKLAKRCTYTPDFAVMMPDGQIELHEVKGFWMDDAKVKIKMAAKLFPFKFIAVKVKPKKDGGGWKVEEF